MAAEQVDHQEAVHQVAQMVKVKQHIQVDKAVTLDHSHTRDQVAVAEEPL